MSCVIALCIVEKKIHQQTLYIRRLKRNFVSRLLWFLDNYFQSIYTQFERIDLKNFWISSVQQNEFLKDSFSKWTLLPRDNFLWIFTFWKKSTEKNICAKLLYTFHKNLSRIVFGTKDIICKFFWNMLCIWTFWRDFWNKKLLNCIHLQQLNSIRKMNTLKELCVWKNFELEWTIFRRL